MFEIPISIALIPYGLALLLFLIFAIVDGYHLIHYGETTKVSYWVTFVFFAVSATILFVTLYLLRGTDWSQSFTIALPFVGSTPQAPTI